MRNNPFNPFIGEAPRPFFNLHDAQLWARNSLTGTASVRIWWNPRAINNAIHTAVLDQDGAVLSKTW
jgi:hypothetical protein